VPLPMLMAELVRRVGGRSQRARAVRARGLDGVWSRRLRCRHSPRWDQSGVRAGHKTFLGGSHDA